MNTPIDSFPAAVEVVERMRAELLSLRAELDELRREHSAAAELLAAHLAAPAPSVRVE